MAHPLGDGTPPTTPYGIKGTHWRACGFHTGADWARNHGTPVYAVEDGDVRYRSYGSAFGLQLAVSPDKPGEWFYAHLSWRAPNGARVKAGDLVGRVGNTGNSTGPHLHLEYHTVKQRWVCSEMRDPWKIIQSMGGSSGYPTPTSNTVYLSKLKYGQQDSDSVWYLQRALGMDEKHWVGDYGPLTDAAVRSCQLKHVPPADPEGKSFVGPTQAAHLFDGTGIRVVDDRPKEPDPTPDPDQPAMTGLKGIDISSHQSGINLADVPADFVILKTTEGSTYLSPDAATQYQAALDAGRLVGLYHFARNDTDGSMDDALEEADWFIESARQLDAVGTAVLVLDWERKPYDDVEWAQTWLDRVRDVLGVDAMIYMNQYCANLTDWSPISARHPLWIAKYTNAEPPPGYDDTPPNPPNIDADSWPDGWAIWQYTSKGDLPGYDGWLDLNGSNLTADDWHAMAASTIVEPDPEDYVTRDEYNQLAARVDAIEKATQDAVADLTAKHLAHTHGKPL